MTGMRRGFHFLVVIIFLGMAYQTYGNLVEEYKNGLIWNEPAIVTTSPNKPPL